MKRSLMVFLILCLAFSLLSPAAFAAGSSYKLDELGMSIELPQDYIVFTRDIKSNDPNLSAYGLTRDELYSLMVDGCIYLNAWDKDLNYEIIVTMTDSPVEDFNLYSDTALMDLASSAEDEYRNYGITYIKSELYQHSQAKFIKIYISQQSNGSTVYGLEYSTVYNSKAINITLQSYSGKINSSKEAILKEIVDSVRFDTAPSAASLENNSVGSEGGNIFSALLNVLFIGAIFSLPIIIYRYAVKRRPVERKKAWIVSLLYSIFSALDVLAILAFQRGWLLAAFLLLWSWANYRILTGKRKKDVPVDGNPAESAVEGQKNAIPYPHMVSEGKPPEEDPACEEADSIRFCHQCGSELVSGSMFCSKCGAEIPVLEKKNQQERSRNHEL